MSQASDNKKGFEQAEFSRRTLRQVAGGFLVVALCLALFVTYSHRRFLARGQQLVAEHAAAVARDVHNRNPAGVEAYLNLAARICFYKSIDVVSSDGTSFLHFEGPGLEGIDLYLFNAGLMPVHAFSAEIDYQGRKIGLFKTVQYCHIFYHAFNFLIFLLLVMFFGLFVFNLISSRRFLEKRIEDEITRSRASKKRFIDLVNLLPEIVWEADLQGKVTFANQAAQERFEVLDESEENRQEPLVYNIFDFLVPEDRERARNDFLEAVKSPKTDFKEYTALSWSGTTYPILCRLTPVYDNNQQLAGARGIVIDITELRQLEQRLDQAQKMEAIGTLAGGIAHDFNNILTAIIGYIQLVELKLKKDSPALVAQLDQALQAADRARDLVQQILTFSRRSKQDCRLLEMRLVVRETVKLIRSSVPSTIEIRESLSAPGIVMADEARLHQMTMNLCTNAYQAMEEQQKGIMEIDLCEVVAANPQVPGSPLRRYLRLMVSDTGCGIESDDLKKIFDPYFTTKETGKGTGLGLAVVHGIVEEYEGFIEVESSSLGTSFHVYLPLASSEVEVLQPEELPEQPFASGRGEPLLLIDDEENVLEVVGRYLEEAGYRVDAYSDPARALQKFFSDPAVYRLVITDQTMPGMTGLELSVKIKEIRPECPVILCSGYRAALDNESLRRSGVDLFFQKPLAFSKLAAAVRKLIDQTSR